MRTRKSYEQGEARPGFRRYCRLVKLYDACLANARSLQQEAALLLANGFAPRAFALAYTGWEEVGKAQIVADFAGGLTALSEFKDAFRDHKLKCSYNSRRFELSASDRSRSVIEYDVSSARGTFEARQRAFYVGCDASDAPLLPTDNISINLAEQAVNQLQRELDRIRLFDAMNESIGSRSYLK